MHERVTDGEQNIGQLLRELGSLGISEVRIGDIAKDEASITAVIVGGDKNLEFGYGQRGFHFAHRAGKDAEGEPEQYAYVREWDPSLVATRQTWQALESLRVLGTPQTHDLTGLSERSAERKVFGDFSHLFSNTSEDQTKAAQLQAAIEEVRQTGAQHLVVLHDSGIAQHHRVMVDGFENDDRYFAVNQAGTFCLTGPELNIFIPIEDAPNNLVYQAWKKLQVVSDITFNRMAHPSAVVLELNPQQGEQTDTPES